MHRRLIKYKIILNIILVFSLSVLLLIMKLQIKTTNGNTRIKIEIVIIIFVIFVKKIILVSSYSFALIIVVGFNLCNFSNGTNNEITIINNKIKLFIAK